MRKSYAIFATGIFFLLGITSLLSFIPGMIYPDIPFRSLTEVGKTHTVEEFKQMYDSIPYAVSSAKMMSNMAGYVLVATGIAIYIKDKRKKQVSYFSVKEEKVNMKNQTIAAAIIGYDLLAAYRVKKLRLYVSIVLGIAIPLSTLVYFMDLGNDNYYWGVDAVVIPIAICCIRKWSKQWNKQIIENNILK